MRRRPNQPRSGRVGIRITEDPSLYGLLLREHDEVIEYVSYREARLRVGAVQSVRNHRMRSRTEHKNGVFL